MPQQITHLVNGQPSDFIAVTNRGLAYGDGLFETIRFHGSEAVLWARHWQRLIKGCQYLELNLAGDFEANILAQCKWLIEQNTLTQAVVKIVLTREGAGGGYRPHHSNGTHTIVSISDVPKYPSQNYSTGVRTWLCKTRLSVNPRLAGIKHLNRLEQVLATREWSESSHSEGIMMDTCGHIIEGTRSNIFFVQNGILITPSLKGSGIAGVMREHLLDCSADLGLSFDECSVALDNITAFQEAFICNSVFGIWPLVSLELGKGEYVRWTPGKVTRSLQQAVSDQLKLGMCPCQEHHL